MSLRYEPLSAAHAPELFPVLSPEIVWAHIEGSEERTLEEMGARYARVARGPAGSPGERWVNFALRLGDGALCGRVEATVHDAGGAAPWAEIAYLLGPAYWGRGLASEAVAWLMAHLREAHGVRELWAAVRPDNARSCRLLLRLGFRAAPRGVRPLASEDPGDLLFRHG